MYRGYFLLIAFLHLSVIFVTINAKEMYMKVGDSVRIEQLKCLVDVAETKSMSKTAERLFVSPQAVSKSIKQLEEELDAELLVRTNQGVALTKIGEEVLAHAKQMLDLEQKLNQSVERHKERDPEENTFPIRICSTSAITNIVLPSILTKFANININIIPRIDMVDSVREVFERLKNNTYDIGLLTYNEQDLFRQFASYQQVLDMDLLARDEMVVVMERRWYEPGTSFLSSEQYHSRFRSMYCMLPTEEMEKYAREVYVMRSNDADFHRAMMRETGAYVIMPKLAYQHFFSNKSYIALPLEGIENILLHVAVYRQDADERLKRFASLISIALK